METTQSLCWVHQSDPYTGLELCCMVFTTDTGRDELSRLVDRILRDSHCPILPDSLSLLHYTGLWIPAWGWDPTSQRVRSPLLKNPCGFQVRELAHPLHISSCLSSVLPALSISDQVHCSWLFKPIALQVHLGLEAAILESPCLPVDFILCFQESHRFVWLLSILLDLFSFLSFLIPLILSYKPQIIPCLSMLNQYFEISNEFCFNDFMWHRQFKISLATFVLIVPCS